MTDMHMKNSNRKSKHIAIPALLGAAALGVLATKSFSATGTWNVDASGNWSDTGNWLSGIVADGPTGNSAFFTNDITATRTVSVDVNRTIGIMNFSDNGASGSSWIVSGPGALTASAAVLGTPVTISATLTPTSTFQVNGANNAPLTLSGTNTYTGATRLSTNSILRANEGIGLPTASNLNFFAPTNLGIFESSGTFTRKTGTGAGQVSWGTAAWGGFSAYGGNFVIQLTNASNVANGPLTWGSNSFLSNLGSILNLNSPTADSLVDFQNPIAFGTSNRGISVLDNPSLTTDRARVSGTLTSTGGGLSKSGLGILEVTGANTYVGNTTIIAGTLLANNVLGSATGLGNVTVNSGATFGGTGAVAGSVTINSGGTLAPGASIESLSTGAVSLASGSNLNVEIDAGIPDADLLDVTGTVSLTGSNLNLALANVSSITTSATYLLINNDAGDSITGTFANITGLPLGYDATIDYAYAGTDSLGRVGDGNDLAVTITNNVPEPASVGVMVVALGMLLGKRKTK